jgi:alkylhydroperoxidase family enzyme
MTPFVSPAELSSTPAEFQTMVKQSPALDINILKTWAHSPATIELAARWGKAQFSSLALSAQLRELAILQTGILCRSDYELAQHVPMALAVGCKPEQVELLVRRGAEAGFLSTEEAKGAFDEQEMLLLQWVTEVEKQPELSTSVMQEVKKVSSSRMSFLLSPRVRRNAELTEIAYSTSRTARSSRSWLWWGFTGWWVVLAIHRLSLLTPGLVRALAEQVARLTTVLQIEIDEVDGLEVMKGFQGIAAVAEK